MLNWRIATLPHAHALIDPCQTALRKCCDAPPLRLAVAGSDLLRVPVEHRLHRRQVRPAVRAAADLPAAALRLRAAGAAAVVLSGARRGRTGSIGHIAVAGLLLQAGYLGGVWCAIKLGMPAGLSALIVGMQPILTAAAAPLIGETRAPAPVARADARPGRRGAGGRMRRSTWPACRPLAIGYCLLALLSITAGTMYQRRFCPRFDLRTGTVIQFARHRRGAAAAGDAVRRLRPEPCHSKVDAALHRRLAVVGVRAVDRRDFPAVQADPPQRRHRR